MKRILMIALLLGGCTSVRVGQRDSCWVKQTDHWYGGRTEEVGPCQRAAPAWAEDRITRLVQECVAQEDYRWQNLALAAWSKGQEVPQRQPDDKIVDRCMQDSTRLVLTENENLRDQVEDLTAARERFQAQNEHLGDVLGEAAKKPAGTAIATANAKGDSSMGAGANARQVSDFAGSPAGFPRAPVAAPMTPAAASAPVKEGAPALTATIGKATPKKSGPGRQCALMPAADEKAAEAKTPAPTMMDGVKKDPAPLAR